MASAPQLKVYAPTGQYVACCKYAEDAAAIVAIYGEGSEIRIGHKKTNVAWREGAEAQPAAESFDYVAMTVCRRAHEIEDKNAAKAPAPQPFRVKLAHAPNIDIPGGYWQDGNPDAPVGWVGADSIAHASRICRDYISDHGLGGGNWTGGAIIDAKTGDSVGRISYNGRAWNLDGTEITFDRKG